MTRLEARIPAATQTLSGDLIIPDGAKGLVLFAHGSGSSRGSPRNQSVAATLRTAGIGTLLFDLLTSEEEQRDAGTAELRFDIGFLAERLLVATRWAREHVPDLSIGYFGASTGAAAALMAEAEAQAEGGDRIGAIVSRGGRPDLAGEMLRLVRSPTLLIVGALDRAVIRMNQEAYLDLECEKQLTLIPGASHLFEEPGTLDQVARLATEWFERHLIASSPEPRAITGRRSVRRTQTPHAR